MRRIAHLGAQSGGRASCVRARARRARRVRIGVADKVKKFWGTWERNRPSRSEVFNAAFRTLTDEQASLAATLASADSWR
jgi:hypothetical protein